jgi:RHS repeat-associated protein
MIITAKHTEPTQNSHAAAYGYKYMYDGFGGNAQASHGVSWSHTVTESGSSAWITDGSGNACTARSRSVNQHLQYLPFGESFIDQRTNHDIRFKFTTKEEDSETGYQYFGARYLPAGKVGYASDLSIWLSVDPMSDKYLSTSPYMYVRGNPIMLIDPYGLSDRRPKKGKKPRRRRIRYRTRTMGSGQKLRWRNQSGKSPDQRLHKFGSFFGVGRRIGTIKVARYRTSGWTNVAQTSGTGRNGRTTYKHIVADYSSYALRNIRVIGNQPYLQGVLITGGRLVGSGAFGTPINGSLSLQMPSITGNYIYSQGGFIPFIGSYLASKVFSSGNTHSIIYLVATVLNAQRINPAFRNMSNFAVYKIGNNANISLQIKFRVRQQITNRSRISNWFHGLN